RVAVMRDMPPLIKAYLRLGGTVGAGAFVDHAFNTTDVCLILPTAAVPDRQRQRFEQGTRARG
ncbi:MAG: ornithine-acyl-ACP acyltransferase, partial [Pseudomonadota bacterium]